VRDLVSTLILLGALQGAVLSLVLWQRVANRVANRMMAALVALVTLMLLAGEIERRWGFPRNPHLLGLSAPLPFLFGPLLYLFVLALTRPVTRPDPRWLVHALPFVGDALYMAQVFYFEAPAVKLAMARASVSGQVPASFYIVSVLEVVQALTYIGLAWGALARYGRKIHGHFSDLTHIDLRWLRILVAAHAAVWSVVLLTTVLRWLGAAPTALLLLVQLASALAIFLTGYVSLWQPELAARATAAQAAEPSLGIPAEPPRATGEPPPEASRSDPAAPEPRSMEPHAPVPLVLLRATPEAAAPTPPRYERNRLDDDEAKGLLAKLEEFMDVRRAYLDPNLTLTTLADALGITPHMLSQLLNVWVGKSFFVYVNGRRADALMAALADPRNAQRGVLDLGFEVGFSSKSTLNSFFKKHTSTTPTTFRARALAQKSAAKSHG
jgi:AraC-like DNA-binding protein